MGNGVRGILSKPARKRIVKAARWQISRRLATARPVVKAAGRTGRPHRRATTAPDPK